MTIDTGTIVKPTPGAATSVFGVPSSAKMSAELSATVAVCSTTPKGMSAATMARCVDGAAPPEVGPAQKVFAGLFGRLSVRPIVPLVVSGEPATAAESSAAGVVSVMAMDV